MELERDIDMVDMMGYSEAITIKNWGINDGCKRKEVFTSVSSLGVEG